jgi:hypothetical protein
MVVTWTYLGRPNSAAASPDGLGCVGGDHPYAVNRRLGRHVQAVSRPCRQDSGQGPERGEACEVRDGSLPCLAHGDRAHDPHWRRGEHEPRVLSRQAAQQERVGGREHALGLTAPVLGRIKSAHDQPASAPGSCLHDAEAVPAEQRERLHGQIDVRHAWHQARSLPGRCSHDSLLYTYFESRFAAMI